MADSTSTTNKPKKIGGEKKEKTKSNLGKIDTATISEDRLTNAEEAVESYSTSNIDERLLLEATRLLLRQHSIRKSSAAVRDAVETPHEVFGPSQAVSALSKFGLKTTSGGMVLTTLLVFVGMVLISVFTATLTSMMVGDDSNKTSDNIKLYVENRLKDIEKKIDRINKEVSKS